MRTWYKSRRKRTESSLKIIKQLFRGGLFCILHSYMLFLGAKKIYCFEDSLFYCHCGTFLFLTMMFNWKSYFKSKFILPFRTRFYALFIRSLAFLLTICGTRQKSVIKSLFRLRVSVVVVIFDASIEALFNVTSHCHSYHIFHILCSLLLFYYFIY